MAILIHHPQIILLWVAQNYLSQEKFQHLLDNLGQGYKTDGKFLRIFLRHFDLNDARKRRIAPLDDLIFNYLEYDCKSTRLPRNKLIARYESEVVALPSAATLREFRKLLNVD
jgi:hypothetical protein